MARDSWLKRLIWLRGSPAGGSGASYEKTVGPAPIISISDAKAKPAKSLIVGMEPIQAGSGDPSPDNIRPISGRTGVTVERTGKNVLPYPFSDGDRITENGITFSVASDGVVEISGTATGVAYYDFSTSTNKILLKAGTYTKTIPENANVQFNIYKSAGNPISAGNNATFTLSEDTEVYCYLRVAEVASFDTALRVYPQIEVGSTATAYEPYTGTSYPVSWQSDAGTVYGGTVDVVTGVLTVTHGMVDLGALNWFDATTNSVFYAPVSGCKNNTGAGNIPDAVSSQYAVTSAKSNYGWSLVTDDCLFSLGYDSARIYVRDTRYSDAATFMNNCSGVKVCYPLATPVTYQLTSQQIQMLKGANTLWSDADNLTLTYLGTTPANLLGGMLGGGLGGGYNPPAEQDPEELTEPEATETDEPAEETPAEEGENNGE